MATTSRAAVRNPWTVMAILNLGLFMTMLDMTIVNVAIPSIISGLRATLDQLLWVINGYSLVYAMLLITSGRLGDILGPRNLFLAGTMVFAAASAGSGFSHSATELIAARAGQGVGAAMLAPQTLAYVAALFPPERRGSASGMTGGIAGIALVAGPTLGGFITTHFGWSWVFFMNLPISVVTVALTLLFVPDVRPGVRHRLDVLGVLLATAGIFGVVFGLIEGQRYNWGTVWSFVTIPEILGAAVAVLLIFLLTQYARRASEPLLPLAIFRQRNFTAMIVVIGAVGFAIIGIFLPFTIYLQSVLGLSAQDAGLTVAPTVIAIMVMAPISGALADRIGGKYLLTAGLLLFVVGMALIAQTESPTSDRWSFLPGLLVAGIGMGLTFAPLYSIALRTLDARFGGVASGVINTVQEVGSVIASAAVGAL
ncbi:MAG TPA: DHA2 family efflux MFS transporter permease subunit, partial [Chloroflexota bacterium]|nr:DHA2 family efflux MFS transporter permease subunit [Chloroflexota bacterium]